MLSSEFKFRRKELEPADILSAAATIPVSDAHTCNWFQEKWITPQVYLEWARRSLSEGKDDYNLINAVCHAKRTACRIIDHLILSNHLYVFKGKNYPIKITALSQIDISIVPIVHKLVIDPRNQLEHEYERAHQEEAEEAVQIADLFLNASRTELERKPIVALAWNVQVAHSIRVRNDEVQESVGFHGFSDHPMLFVDVFTEPAEVKIVHPDDQEIYFTLLSSFTEGESIVLAKKLREHYAQQSGSWGTDNFSAHFFVEVKRQSGI